MTHPADYEWFGIYIAFGRAACDAQTLEKALVSLCTLLKLGGASATDLDYNQIYDQFNKKTLGQLEKEVRKLSPPGMSVAFEWLPEALSQRNFLNHDFFWEYAPFLETEPGRQHAMTKLADMGLTFRTATEAASIMTDVVRRKLGITEEKLAVAVRALNVEGRNVH